MESTSTGDRIRVVRKRRGMTQRELAATAGLSYSTVKKIEQGTYGGIRLETLRKLAAAVKVPTTTLMQTAGQHEPEAPDSTMWGPVRQAIAHPHQAASPAPVTGRGLSDALLAAVKLYQGNRYDLLALALPPLLADAEDGPPLLRSRVLQLAGSAMVQTRQHEAARVALDRSLADAQASGSTLDAASAVVTMCWLLLIDG